MLRFLIGLLMLVFLSPLNATPSNDNISNRILAVINHYRSEHHLGSLKLDSRISQVAEQHSKDMAAHRMAFGHDGFNKRITALYKLFPGANGGAENVAYNYKPSVVGQKWIESPGHRRNIQGLYNLTGIGIAADKQGKIYYTQIFLRTR